MSRRSLHRMSGIPRPVDESSSIPAGSQPSQQSGSASSSGQDQPAASSSKVTLDMPPLDLPESIMWDYEPVPHPPVQLSKDDKEQLMQELMNFAPYPLLYDVAEHVRMNIYPTVTGVEGWAQAVAADRREFNTEVEKGSHALETLLENHIDRAFDKYTAYALRNCFSIPDGIELVLPWHQDMDFPRAQFVQELEGGEEVLAQRLQSLRDKVEQARLVSHRLAQAEAVLDKRLRVAEHRRSEVGFVRDAVTEAGLAPLDAKARGVVDALSSLHTNLEDVKMQPRAPGVPPGVAWETGRQAYLSWAVGKALAGGREEVPADRLDALERQTTEVGSEADLEALGKAARGK